MNNSLPSDRKNSLQSGGFTLLDNAQHLSGKRGGEGVKTRKKLLHQKKVLTSEKGFNLKTIITDEFERYKIYEKPVIIPENNGYTGKRGRAKNREKSIRQAIKRAKEKIYGYIMANEWEYWATQTFSPKAIDRFNLDEIVRRYNQKLKDLRRRKYSNLKWLIVPEQHNDGAWHLHAFMSGIPADKVVYSGYDYFNKKRLFRVAYITGLI